MVLRLVNQRCVFKHDTMRLRFFAESGLDTVICWVTVEALRNNFGLRTQNPCDAVKIAETHRDRIEQVARCKHESRDGDDCANILICSDDFGEEKTPVVTGIVDASVPSRQRCSNNADKAVAINNSDLQIDG